MGQKNNTIIPLAPYIVNQLKAGEIVERPSSIVKELIENALDADADRIEIHIERGGKQRIVVEDNGHGIAQTDMPHTIERYATSKIQTIDDLMDIASYGFRGEALASIADVSECTITSTVADQPYALQLTKSQMQPHLTKTHTHLAHGTVVDVRHLFDKIPARKKFLTSDTNEWRYILGIITDFALIHYDKERLVYHNNKCIFHITPTTSRMERVVAVYHDVDIAHLHPFIYGTTLQCEGVASDNHLTFPKRTAIHISINNRPVQDPMIGKAIMQSYHRQLQPGRFPLCVLSLHVPPDEIDINVHPRKTQIRFHDSGSIFRLINHSLQTIFTQKTERHGSLSSRSSSSLTSSSADTQQHSHQDSFFGDIAVAPKGYMSSTMGGDDTTLPPIILHDEQIEIIGQLRDSYIIAASPTQCYIGDQHALAERIIFDTMRQRAVAQLGQSTSLLTPLAINVIGYDEEHATARGQRGFDIAVIDAHNIIVYALPTMINDMPIDLTALFHTPPEYGGDTLDDLISTIIATRACKAAIKANQPLTHHQMHMLLYDACRYITGLFVCQHGRTAMHTIAHGEINKRFHR